MNRDLEPEADPSLPLVRFPVAVLLEIVEWLDPQRLTALLDATDLKADTQEAQIRQLAAQAVQYGCASVCVNPVEVDLLPELLRGSGVKECYVLDFPLGKSTIALKAEQAARTVAQSRSLRGEGAQWVELDMVINVGRLKQDPRYTQQEVAAVVEAADGAHVKVIIRSAELLEGEIVTACQVAQAAGAHFVKNSTGMDAFGATPEHIRLMRRAVGTEMGVKAAGGIREAIDVVRLIYAGALDPALRTAERFRIGTSNPLTILSTFDALRQSPQALSESEVIPCSICPSGYAERQSAAVRDAYLDRCARCPFRHCRPQWVKQRG